MEGNNRGAQSSFARNIGCGRAQVSSWLKGRATPSNDYEAKMIEVYHLNLNWLKYGEGDMFLSTSTTRYKSPIQDYTDEPPLLGVDDPKQDFAFRMAKIFEKNSSYQLVLTDDVVILDRKPVVNEIFLSIPFDIPEEELYEGDGVTLCPYHKSNIKSGYKYLIQCEKGIIISTAYVLRDGRILVHINSSEDFLPKEITACYEIIPTNRSPHKNLVFSEDKKARIEKTIRDYHNKEKAGKTLLLITESLLSFHFLLVALLTLISSMENGVPLPMWALFNGFMASVHLMIVAITKESVTEFCMTRWQKCFAQKFRDIRYSFGC